MIAIILLAAALVKGGNAEPDPLSGKWELTSVQMDGLDVFKKGNAEESEPSYYYRFEGGKAFGRTGSRKEEQFSSYSLPKSQPKMPANVDFSLKLRGKELGCFKGIYAVHGDQLRIALSVKQFEMFAPRAEGKATPGTERPKSFDSAAQPSEGDHVIVFSMKKVK